MKLKLKSQSIKNQRRKAQRSLANRRRLNRICKQDINPIDDPYASIDINSMERYYYPPQYMYT